MRAGSLSFRPPAPRARRALLVRRARVRARVRRSSPRPTPNPHHHAKPAHERTRARALSWCVGAARRALLVLLGVGACAGACTLRAALLGSWCVLVLGVRVRARGRPCDSSKQSGEFRRTPAERALYSRRFDVRATTRTTRHHHHHHEQEHARHTTTTTTHTLPRSPSAPRATSAPRAERGSPHHHHEPAPYGGGRCSPARRAGGSGSHHAKMAGTLPYRQPPFEIRE